MPGEIPAPDQTPTHGENRAHAETPARAQRRAPGARRTHRGRALALLSALLLVPALAGCGESKEEKAKKSVCAARTEIKTELEHLGSLTPSTAAISELQQGATKIAASLKKMAEAEKDLAPARKEEVAKATEEFQKAIGESVSSVTKGGLSPSALVSDVSTALANVKAAYTKALAPISCS